MNDKSYLKIGGIEFIDSLTPSEITPGTEIIKTEERSIDGTMNIDIVTRKAKLQIAWSILKQAEMGRIMQIAESTQIFDVEYIDALSGQSKKIRAYPSDISYLPHFIGEHIMWRDVSLTLTEI